MKYFKSFPVLIVLGLLLFIHFGYNKKDNFIKNKYGENAYEVTNMSTYRNYLFFGNADLEIGLLKDKPNRLIMRILNTRIINNLSSIEEVKIKDEIITPTTIEDEFSFKLYYIDLNENQLDYVKKENEFIIVDQSGNHKRIKIN